jgi:Fur family zinc uptake transcriptional regulator
MPAFNNAAASFSGDRHDHRACVEVALATAARLCLERRARLTPLRRRVLELVWRGHAPVGAYDILGRLSAEHGTAEEKSTAQGTAAEQSTAKERRPTAPPTVYRALEFLLAQGLIHRIESLNAYVGCVHPDGAHGGQFLICTGCGATAEVHDPRVDAAVARRAEELGFAVARKTIEVEGLCPPCQRRREGADAR